MVRLRKKASVLLGDLLLVTMLVAGVAWLVPVADPWGGLAIVTILPGAFYVTGLYELEPGGFRSRPIIQIIVGCIITGVAVATLDFLLQPLLVSRRLLVGSLTLIALLLGPWRLALESLARRRGRARVPLVLLGRNGATDELVGLLNGHALFHVRDIVSGPQNGGSWSHALEPLVTRTTAAATTSAAAPPTVVVADAERLPGTAYTALLDLRHRGVRVLDLARFWEEATGRLPVAWLSDEWLALHSEILPERRGIVARVKRLVDVAGSLLLLVVLAIPTALAAAALWLNDPGRILFRQERVGQGGATFQVLKLRTTTGSRRSEGWSGARDSTRPPSW